MVACGRGLNRSVTVTESRSSVVVPGIVPGFLSMLVDNHGSFFARKQSCFSQLKHVSRQESLWF